MLARKTFPISTAALKGDEATYLRLEAQLNRITDARDLIAVQTIEMLERPVFDNRPINEPQAEAPGRRGPGADRLAALTAAGQC